VWGEAACFVPPDDVDALSGAIRWLTDSPARRNEMGERARLRAARYAPRRMAEQYLAAYRRLVHQADGPPSDAVSNVHGVQASSC
jgi:glycogen synthase